MNEVFDQIPENNTEDSHLLLKAASCYCGYLVIPVFPYNSGYGIYLLDDDGDGDYLDLRGRGTLSLDDALLAAREVINADLGTPSLLAA